MKKKKEIKGKGSNFWAIVRGSLYGASCCLAAFAKRTCALDAEV